MTKDVNMFESMLAFTAQLEKPVAIENNHNGTGAFREEFTQTRDFNHASELARNGWPDGLKKIERALEDIEAMPVMEPLPVFDVCGEAFNLDAVLTGQPENMFYFMPQESNKPRIVQIAFNFVYSAGVPANDIIDRGAAIASAVNDIENQGMRVELFAYCATRNNRKTSSCFIKLKDAEQPLELERVVFAVAHPSMLRRLWFKYAEQHEDFEKRFSHDYGNCCEPKPEHFKQAGITTDQMILVDMGACNAARVKKTITNQLENILAN